MKVAILGAGPVGLVAAHAARSHGHDVKIHGIAIKSSIKGAQYLHKNIPGLTDTRPDGEVTYIKLGTKQGYADKVYGDPHASCSWDQWDGTVPAWSMSQRYDELWDRFQDRIFDEEIRKTQIERMLDDYDLIISSINPLGYCFHQDEHVFEWQQVRITNSVTHAEPQQIIYNGIPEDPWYRSSLLFGAGSTESPNGKRDLGQPVRKPLRTSCTCFSNDKFVRVGRYGAFRKNLLVTDAYRQAVEALNAM